VGFRITGDYGKLERFELQLRTAPRQLAAVSRNMAEEGLTLVALGFRAARDPYGGAWASRKSGSGGRALLVRTGALRNSFHVISATKAAFVIGTGIAYARFHQNGTTHMVARRMLPRKGALPGRWAAAFREVYDEIMTAHFR
jgi:phage gpG-like protein